MLLSAEEELRMSDDLATSLTEGASLRGNEYGWPVNAFPDALVRAEAMGYACLAISVSLARCHVRDVLAQC
jgi:hypothetical protein